MFWLDEIKNETNSFEEKRKEAFEAEKRRWKERGLDKFISENETTEIIEEIIPKGAAAVRASMTGVVWKITVKAGQEVKKGDTIIVEESMKMELSQTATKTGTVEKICVCQGQRVNAGQTLAIIR